MNWKATILWIIGVIFLGLLLKKASCTATYTVKPITTDMDIEPDIFVNNTSIECVPGPGPRADYYTQENSQGICGLQDYVHDLGHTYMINNGIGGSLLVD